MRLKRIKYPSRTYQPSAVSGSNVTLASLALPTRVSDFYRVFGKYRDNGFYIFRLVEVANRLKTDVQSRRVVYLNRIV